MIPLIKEQTTTIKNCLHFYHDLDNSLSIAPYKNEKTQENFFYYKVDWSLKNFTTIKMNEPANKKNLYEK